MLKGLALDYYYSNVSISGISVTFDEACYAIRAYFEGAEYKRSVLSKWNGIKLKSVMSKTVNEGKPMEESCSYSSRTYDIYSMDSTLNSVPTNSFITSPSKCLSRNSCLPVCLFQTFEYSSRSQQ